MRRARGREKRTKIGHHDWHVTIYKDVRSATRPLLKSTIPISLNPFPCISFSSIAYVCIYSTSTPMPLVRSQGDEFCHIEPDLDATSIERWRVGTSYSQRSSDLRSSLKCASWNPRFSSKTASWATAAHHVVRLERVQEDEEGDDQSAYQLGLPQISMETNVSDFLHVYSLGPIVFAPGSDRRGENRRIYLPCMATG